MKLRLDIESADGSSTPVTVTAEGTATTAELAGAIEAARSGIPADSDHLSTLQILGEHGDILATLPASTMLTETRLHSGQRVRVIADQPTSATDAAAAVGWLRVISGPVSVEEFPLRLGAQLIGRDKASDIVLLDEQVSRRHARLTVGERQVEITDLNSSNGVIVGDTLVDHATLGPRDVVTLGETRLVVDRVDAAPSDDDPGYNFNRSPVVRAPYVGRKFQAPQPPSQSTPNRFPLIAMAAPLVMGLAMFIMTRNPLSVVFVALSPIIAVGTWFDHRFTQRKASDDAIGAFDDAMTQLAKDASRALSEEHRGRCGETPSLATLMEAAYALSQNVRLIITVVV